MNYNFVRYCLSNGGMIKPLVIPIEDSVFVGECNPSILFDGDRLRMILRKVNYALWCSDNQYKFTSNYGPLWYMTYNDDIHLITKNYLCDINDDGITYNEINTEKFDKEPLWEFVGLEDARLVRWDNKLYGTGVRRDTTENGQGRMELSELDDEGNEISRVRIKAPDEESYCEKNWMPILDMPFHYVRWCNPVEVVKVNPETGDCEVVVTKEQSHSLEYYTTNCMDIRGSSQVIPWGEYRIAITHMCELWLNEKNEKSNVKYFEQFIVWDKDWNIVRLSQPFKFAGFGIEFTNGLAYKDGNFYIPFALQDNISFMITINEEFVRKFIFEDYSEFGDYGAGDNIILQFFEDTTDSYRCMNLGNLYYDEGYFSGAMVLYERACEYNTFMTKNELFDCMYMCGKSIANMGNRDDAEIGLWHKLVDLDINRSEGYLMMSKYYFWRNMYFEAYTFSKIAYELNNYGMNLSDALRLNSIDGEIQYIKSMYFTENYRDCQPKLNELKKSVKLTKDQRGEINNIIYDIINNVKNKKRIL